MAYKVKSILDGKHRENVHKVADCMECDWSSENYKENIREQAKKHCKETGHEVRFEIAKIIHYKRETV